MEAHIQALVDEKGPLIERLTKLDDAIRALQDVCEHDWKYDGHNSHEDYYVCNKCGKGRWY